ncbi:MAG: hypothetical protein A3G75_08855 [Verrucomicrobia bacterium RIFCSPLOWO2_12_FULL_64_8]|nr:MAG: hypothetical protein A3G75_08855 [Verrucomicrobia bacterium RIFCSPLOWO2_12_FULL_64_8]
MNESARRNHLSFQAKVLMPVLGILVLLPVITLWIVNDYISRQVLAEARQTLATAKNVFLDQLDNRSANLLARFRNVVTDPRFKAVAQLRDPDTMTAYLRESWEDLHAEYELIYFTTANGQVLPGARRDPAITYADFEQAAAVLTRRALGGEQGAGTISLNGRAFNAVSFPVFVSDKGPPVGALTTGIRVTEADVQKLKTLTGTEILLAADAGVAAATIREPDLPPGLMQLITAPVAAGGIQRTPVAINGEHFLALSGDYQRTDPSQGFRYVLLSSYEARLLALENTRTTLIEISAAGILISGFVVWYLIRRITQPLLDLREGAEAVGRGDFSRRIERFSNDECGEVADAFNRMTQNLQGSRAELEKTFQRLKATQAQLIQSEKLSAVGQFVAGVAHELNNPLTTLIGFSELLKQMDLGAKERHHVEYIANSADRCHKIVRSLLGFARQHEPERKPVKLSEIVDAVIEFLAYDLRTSNISVQKDYAPDVPRILGDAHQLQQVVLNIVSNARQALEPFRGDGKITFATSSAGPTVRLSIKDNGPGVPPEYLSRIFDPFFTTKPQGKGTGLGLSLCYGIIQEHGGNITAESRLGAGAEFIIDLPAAVDDSGVVLASSRPPIDVALKPKAGGQSVLVIDDEQWILNLAEEILTGEGFSVDVAEGGAAAHQMLAKRRYDIIISDWKMPGLSGVQIFEDLLAKDPAAARRMLFMTGDVVNDTFQNFLKKHSLACLSKPFSVRDFRAAVARMVEAS